MSRCTTHVATQGLRRMPRDKSFILGSIFLLPCTFETWALIMCLSYSLTSQRRQTLWKSGKNEVCNLMYDGQRATGLPDCLALQKGQLLMYHQRNVCQERRKWNGQNRERGQAETEQNDPPICQRSLKGEGKQHVLPGRHPCNENATHFWKEYYFLTEDTLRSTHSKEIKSLPVSHLSIFFLFLHEEASISDRKSLILPPRPGREGIVQ